MASTQESGSVKRIANYEILGKLGQGAMGAVFKARQETLDRVVALKILPSSIAKDESFIKRFQREARTSAKLIHPHIVQGIDVGKDPASGLWYFAMEFVDGPSLSQVLKERRVMPEAEALRITRQVAEALVCAEKHGVVHRDIKPDNILLNSRGQAKLADLGLARQTGGKEAALTQDGKAIGTPYYMAPEQARGERDQIDIRTDLYALGATLFHLVTGRPPFDGETGAVIMVKHLNEKPPLARQLNPDVSEACSRLIAHLLQKKKSQRVGSPQELIELIDGLGKAQETKGPAKGPTTGPLSPVRKGTTGPRKPVRGRTTGRLKPIGPRGRERSEGGGDASASKQNRTVMIVGAGFGAVFVLSLLIFIATRKEERSVREERPVRETKKSEKNKASNPRLAKGELIKGLGEVRSLQPETPSAFQEQMSKYRALLVDAKVAADQEIVNAVEQDLEKVGERLKTLEEDVWSAYRAQAEDVRKEGDYTAALKVLEQPPEGWEGALASRVEKMSQAIHDEARGKIAPVLTAVGQELKAGAFQKASEGLAALDGVRYAPWNEKISTLKADLKKAEKKALALEQQQEKAVSKKALAELLKKFDESILKKGQWEEAGKVVSEAEKDSSLEPMKDRLAELKAILKADQDVRELEREALVKLVGQTTELMKEKGGSVKGKLMSVQDGLLKLEQVFIINGVEKGATVHEVKVSELSEEQREKLRGEVSPSTDAQRLAAALRALQTGDLKGTLKLLEQVQESPLVARYRQLIWKRKLGAAQFLAIAAWKEIEAFVESYKEKKLDKAGGKELLPLLRDYEAKHLKTAFGKTKAARVKELKAWADEAVIGFSIHKLFKGKVERYDPDTHAISLLYDFEHPAQLKDWRSGVINYTALEIKYTGPQQPVNCAEISGGKLRHLPKRGALGIYHYAHFTGDLEFSMVGPEKYGWNSGPGVISYSETPRSRSFYTVRFKTSSDKKTNALAAHLSYGMTYSIAQKKMPYVPVQDPIRHTLVWKGATLSYAINGKTYFDKWEPKHEKAKMQMTRPFMRPFLLAHAATATYDDVRLKGTLNSEWLETQVAAFRQKNGHAPDAGRAAADTAALKDLDAQTVTGWFKGKVEAFDPKTRNISIFYDFESTEQLDDWVKRGMKDYADVHKGQLRSRYHSVGFARAHCAAFAGDLEIEMRAPAQFGHGGKLYVTYPSSKDGRLASVGLRLAGQLFLFGSGSGLNRAPEKGIKHEFGRDMYDHRFVVRGKQLIYGLGGKVIDRFEPDGFPAQRTLQRVKVRVGEKGTPGIDSLRIKGTLDPVWIKRRLAGGGSEDLAPVAPAYAYRNKDLEEVKRLFKGRVERFYAANRSIALDYDFNSPEQLDDWEFDPRRSKGEVKDGAWRPTQKGLYGMTKAHYQGSVTMTYWVTGAIGLNGGPGLHFKSATEKKWMFLNFVDWKGKDGRPQRRLWNGGSTHLKVPSFVETDKPLKRVFRVDSYFINYDVGDKLLIENYSPKLKGGRSMLSSEQVIRMSIAMGARFKVQKEGIQRIRIEGTLQEAWYKEALQKAKQSPKKEKAEGAAK